MHFRSGARETGFGKFAAFGAPKRKLKWSLQLGKSCNYAAGPLPEWPLRSGSSAWLYRDPVCHIPLIGAPRAEREPSQLFPCPALHVINELLYNTFGRTRRLLFRCLPSYSPKKVHTTLSKQTQLSQQKGESCLNTHPPESEKVS